MEAVCSSETLVSVSTSPHGVTTQNNNVDKEQMLVEKVSWFQAILEPSTRKVQDTERVKVSAGRFQRIIYNWSCLAQATTFCIYYLGSFVSLVTTWRETCLIFGHSSYPNTAYID
jgi:hypothetical protein